MARQFSKRDISPILAAAKLWIQNCLIEDGSVFVADRRWTPSQAGEVYRAFVEHPEFRVAIAKANRFNHHVTS